MKNFSTSRISPHDKKILHGQCVQCPRQISSMDILQLEILQLSVITVGRSYSCLQLQSAEVTVVCNYRWHKLQITFYTCVLNQKKKLLAKIKLVACERLLYGSGCYAMLLFRSPIPGAEEYEDVMYKDAEYESNF